MRLTHYFRQWRNACTVMLAAKPPTNVSNSLSAVEYQILMLERSSKSSFFPSAYVFPGGRVSKHDFSNKWLKVFSSAGITDLTKTLPSVEQDTNERSPMFEEKQCDSPVPNGVAFRLCAIRETFEETGILLHKPAGKEKQEISDHTLNEWRHIVHKDASKFAECCTILGVIPNIWALHEWSNWLTPTNMPELHKNRRYDTAFYISCLPEQPSQVLEDEKEIVSVHWESPDTLIKNFSKEKMWLAPPQVYEISRLCNFKDLKNLSHFAKERETKGCERWLPVRMNCKDGVIATLPGDTVYPGDVDPEGAQAMPDLQVTKEQLMKSSPNLHRFEFQGLAYCKIMCSITPAHGHMNPVPEDVILKESS